MHNFSDEQVEAAADAYDLHYKESSDVDMAGQGERCCAECGYAFWWPKNREGPVARRRAHAMRAALVAAQGAAPPVNSFVTSAERVKNGADSLHVEPQAESDCWHEANCSCPSVLLSSGVDEDALARLLCEKNYVSPDGKPTCAACRDKAHEVAAWLKGQGR